MIQFKQLNWILREDGVLYAEPVGLAKSYYIYPAEPENDHILIELVLIDSHGHYDEKESTLYQTTKLAQEYAQNHYFSILEEHIL